MGRQIIGSLERLLLSIAINVRNVIYLSFEHSKGLYKVKVEAGLL